MLREEYKTLTKTTCILASYERKKVVRSLLPIIYNFDLYSRGRLDLLLKYLFNITKLSDFMVEFQNSRLQRAMAKNKLLQFEDIDEAGDFITIRDKVVTKEDRKSEFDKIRVPGLGTGEARKVELKSQTKSGNEIVQRMGIAMIELFKKYIKTCHGIKIQNRDDSYRMVGNMVEKGKELTLNISDDYQQYLAKHTPEERRTSKDKLIGFLSKNGIYKKHLKVILNRAEVRVSSTLKKDELIETIDELFGGSYEDMMSFIVENRIFANED